MTQARYFPHRGGAFACPRCKKTHSSIIDSRPITDGVRRRRECEACGFRITTYEITKETFDFIEKARRIIAFIKRESP